MGEGGLWDGGGGGGGREREREGRLWLSALKIICGHSEKDRLSDDFCN